MNLNDFYDYQEYREIIKKKFKHDNHLGGTPFRLILYVTRTGSNTWHEDSQTEAEDNYRDLSTVVIEDLPIRLSQGAIDIVWDSARLQMQSSWLYNFLNQHRALANSKHQKKEGINK